LILEMLEEENHPRWIIVRKRLDEKGVDQREDRGRGADSERKGDDADKGEKRVFCEQAKSVA